MRGIVCIYRYSQSAPVVITNTKNTVYAARALIILFDLDNQVTTEFPEILYIER